MEVISEKSVPEVKENPNGELRKSFSSKEQESPDLQVGVSWYRSVVSRSISKDRILHFQM